MKRVAQSLSLALIVIFLSTSCGGSGIQEAKLVTPNEMDIAVADTVALASPLAEESPLEKTKEQLPKDVAPKEEGQEQTNNQWEKKIIKTGNIRVRVDHLVDYETWVKGKVKVLGGYIATEEQHSNNANVQKTLVIKVPVSSFEQLVGEISKQGAELLEKSISAQDVSEEFYDLTTRMASKKKILQQI